MAPNSSTLAWKISGTGEPGRLQSMGSQRADTTEHLHFHFSLSCTGEGNGNPLQCSCLENPRDRGAWWAAVYGVAQSQTRLKRLSSSSNSSSIDTVQAYELSLVNWLFLPVTLKWSQYNNETYSVLDSKDGSSIHGTWHLGWWQLPELTLLLLLSHFSRVQLCVTP